LSGNQAARIMTGAPLPENADAVVMFAQTVESDGFFTIRKPLKPLENVSRHGADVEQGETAIESGNLIHPGNVACLATFGYRTVRVAKHPIVGILSAGTGLLDVSEPLVPGKIRNSNGPMIAVQLARMGIPCKTYGLSVDNLDE